LKSHCLYCRPWVTVRKYMELCRNPWKRKQRWYYSYGFNFMGFAYYV